MKVFADDRLTLTGDALPKSLTGVIVIQVTLIISLLILQAGCKTLSKQVEEDSEKELSEAAREAFQALDGDRPDLSQESFRPFQGYSRDLINWSGQQSIAGLEETEEFERSLPEESRKTRSVAFSPDGRLLASGGGDGKVRLWDADSGEQIHALSGHEGTVFSVAFSHDGKLIASGSLDRTVRVWDAYSGEHLHTLSEHDGSVFSVAFSAEDRLLGSGSSDETVRLWDAESGEHLRTLRGHEGPVFSVEFSRENTLFPEVGAEIYSGGGSGDETLRFWDAETGDNLGGLKVDSSVMSIASSPGGRFLAASWGETVRVWDTDSRELLHTLSGHDGSVFTIAFSPDGRLLASGGEDDTVRLWDAEKGKYLQKLSGHDDWVRSVDFSPDGSLLASGGSDEAVNLSEIVGWISLQTYESRGFELVQERAEDQFQRALGQKSLLSEDLYDRRAQLEQERKQVEQSRPEPPETEQGEFETTGEYSERVQDLRGEYQEQVYEWEERVESLNQSRENLQADIESYYHEELWPRLLHDNFLKVFGGLVYNDVAFDADNQRFIVQVSSDSDLAGDWSQTLELPKQFRSREERRERGPEFMERLKESTPEIDFRITHKGIEWDDASVQVEGESYAMRPVEGAVPDRLRFDMEDIAGDVEVAQLREFDTTAPAWEWEPPDAQQVGRAERQDWEDDLREMIEDIDKVEESSNHYLFAVGIESYREAPDVPYAKRSTEHFREIAHKKLGVPDSSKHMTVIQGRDATVGTIDSKLERMLNRIGEGDVLFFYFSGHGMPNRAGDQAYLLAYDGDPASYDRFDQLALENIYQRLGDSNADRILGFIDACFSGQVNAKEYIFEGVAPTGRMLRDDYTKASMPENMTVLTAGTHEQFSNAYFQRENRLFSYWLMRGILEGKRERDLYTYVRDQVEDHSLEMGSVHQQTPQIVGNISLRW